MDQKKVEEYGENRRRYIKLMDTLCELMKWQAESNHSWEKIGTPHEAFEAAYKIFGIFGLENYSRDRELDEQWEALVAIKQLTDPAAKEKLLKSLNYGRDDSNGK